MRQPVVLLSALVFLTAIPCSLPAAQEVSLYEIAKLLAADGTDTDEFGRSVALSGDTAVVGAYQASDPRFESGSAYIFRRDAGKPEFWGQVAKLTASDGAELDWFGLSVALSGDTAVVGAPNDDDLAPDSGSAYIFRRDAGGPEAWGQIAKLIAVDGAAGDNYFAQFGWSVALSGDTAVVGAPGHGDLAPGSGSAYVFRRDAGGPGAWGQVAKLTAADFAAGDAFGDSVAISGDIAVVGAPFDDDLGFESGSAHVFRRDAGGPEAWDQVAKLTAADGSFTDLFGGSVALSGDTAVVGASGNNDPGLDSGSAYVFRRDAGGPGAWGQVAKLTAADSKAGASFGTVGISGDTAVVGAQGDDDLADTSGAAYIFRRNAGGPEAWGQVAKLTAADGAFNDRFGSSVGISGGTAIIGTPQDDDLGDRSGSAYLFQATRVDPSLSISGTCPGEVMLTGSGLTPKGRFRLYWGFAEGMSAIGEGPCIGTVLGLEQARVLVEARADATGGRSVTRQAPEIACARYLQLVDLTSCALSDVMQIP